MAEKHPYAAGPGGITAAINQFRKSLPPKVNADTLKKLGIAPNNETYIINILRFIGVIDAEGNKTEQAAATFTKHSDADFQEALGAMVKAAYAELFDLHGDATWELPADNLIGFFRQTDQTSEIVGQRQAGTFQALAAIAGHGELPSQKPRQVREGRPKPPKARVELSPVPTTLNEKSAENSHQRDVGLTVRIEVNLPPAADQETYDRIFRSIRENLLNAK